MKAPLLGLGLATAAFAGSSAYLWNQLAEERVRSAQVEQTARELNARIAELEQARVAFGEQRMASANTQGAQTFGHALLPGPTPPAAGVGVKDGKVWTVTRSEPSAAMQKMARTQMRTRNKNLYAEVSQKLGLGKELTDKLVDLLTEQQMAGFSAPFTDPAQVEQHYADTQRANEAAIADLIGPDKAETLKEFQETIPARMEFQSLSHQLSDQDAPLTESQKTRLLAVYLEERQRVPAPEYTTGMSEAEYAKAANAWKDDYERRVTEEARGVLDSRQLAAYNEIQQWQKDMREQMAAAGINMPPQGISRRITGTGNVVTLGAPAFVSGTFVGGATAETTAPKEKKP